MNTKFNRQDRGKIERKLRQLRDDIAMHDRLYYRDNRPQISDFEYDCLKAELLRLEQVAINFGVKTKENLVGNDLATNFQKQPHLNPMQSLANTYSKEELIAFDGRVEKQLHGQSYSYIIEPKIDGIAINLIYENGALVRALTRGDGTLGDDVTNNILTIKSLPRTLNHCPAKIEIRGEVFIDEKTFETTNEHRLEQGLEEYANPRNLAAGTVKSLDFEDVQIRDLKIIVYAIGYVSDDNFLGTQRDVLEQLSAWGFPTQEKYWVAKDINEAWDCVNALNSGRKHFRYWTDGAVLKINELNLHEILGSTAKAPRWAIAYKFAPERVSTKLKNIIFQVGRTGVVTPVADLEPVEVSGSIVSRATLHNGEEIEKKDIRINDYVFLEKAGEIIPAIVSVDMAKRGDDCKPFVFPTRCPSCGCKLIQRENEVAWRCPNPLCQAQLKCKIAYFSSKSAMDIDNLGESVIEKLVENGQLRTVADIYALTYDDLVLLPKLGQKSALNILRNIDLSKNRPLWRLVNGLGIFGIGEQTAKGLCEKFPSIDKISSASKEELADVEGIGEKTIQSIIDFFSSKSNQTILEQLKQHGARLFTEPAVRKEVAQLFEGKTFVLTGSLEKFTRAQAKEIIEANGGRVANAISKKVNVALCGSNSGLKLKQAQELKIEIWDEKTFISKCNSEC
ncbi:MAG: NAD-dependent DNA ligase LigA [Puniceicoccales bacterium]|jgi:DNA ligase (NAD+)|nr:NAD-dependent DNA ligase LigA [Puniceicoccales bacterium]